MDILIWVMKFFCFLLAGIFFVLYLLSNLFQRLPKKKFQITVTDYVAFLAIGILFVFGFSKWYGIFVILPLLLIKIFGYSVIDSKKHSNKGFLMEAQWTKLMPRGVHIPREYESQLKGIPQEMHFVIPRFLLKIGLWFLMRKLRKDVLKVKKKGAVVSGHQVASLEMVLPKIEEMVSKISQLSVNHSEKISLPYGVLKISRY